MLFAFKRDYRLTLEPCPMEYDVRVVPDGLMTLTMAVAGHMYNPETTATLWPVLRSLIEDYNNTVGGGRTRASSAKASSKKPKTARRR